MLRAILRIQGIGKLWVSLTDMAGPTVVSYIRQPLLADAIISDVMEVLSLQPCNVAATLTKAAASLVG